MAKQDVVLTTGLDVKEFNKGLNIYISGLTQMEGATDKASKNVSKFSDTVSTGIGVALGVAAVNSIQSFKNKLMGLGTEVLVILKFFESLQFSLETTIALNVATADSSITMAQAITQSGDAAKSYLLVLQDLAIFSPFTTEEIGQANRILQIYGIMADEALGLTRLITDLASVGGFGAERLQRISLATGQIYAEGRLLARDALQLTQAGVPILKFIENMTGKTTGEIQQMMRRGLLPATLAFEGLVDGLKDFEGAGKRVAGTAQGLFSSLDDIRQISLRDLFTGIFEGIRPFMQELVDATSAKKFRASITALGEAIEEGINSALGRAKKAIQGLINSLRSLPPNVITIIAVFLAARSGLRAFSAAIGIIQLAVTALITPFGLVVSVFAAFVAMWVAGLNRIANDTTEMSTNVSIVGIRLARVFRPFSKNNLKAAESMTKFADNFGKAGEFIIGVFSDIEEAAANVTEFILDLLSSVLSWGQNVGDMFATGISGAAEAVFGAVGVLGAVITGLLKPGSPPKLLPKIDTWGKKTAEEWLKGWTEADFSILDDVTKSIRDQLRSLVSAKKLDNLSAARILVGSRQDIANAVNQINQVGSITVDTMNRIRQSVGPAADEVEQLLHAYEAVAATTRETTAAQEELTRITESYEKIISPLRKELERISEARRKGSEEAEIRNLQRTIANRAVGTSRKKQAQLRIEEILLGRQVRGLEDQRDVAVDGAEKRVSASEKAQDAARLALQLTQDRISAQNRQISLYGEELKAIERLAKELDRLAKKLKKDLLKPFEDAIKRASLMSQEVRDTIGLFKIRRAIASGEATEAERIAAAIEEQAIIARRSKRFFDLTELGVPKEEIERLRSFAVVLGDIGITTTPEFPKIDLSSISEEFEDRIEKFRKLVDSFRRTMVDAREDLNSWLDSINVLLPPYLKFVSATERVAPMFRNVGAALAGFTTIIVSNRFISVLSKLPALILGVGNPFGLLVSALGLLVAAWIGDWGNIREWTRTGIDFVQEKVNEFTDAGGFSQMLPNDSEFTASLGRVQARWSFFVSYLKTSLSEGISVQEFKNSLQFLESAVRETASTLLQVEFFANLQEEFKEFYKVISDPSAMGKAFNTFVLNLRENIINAFKSLTTGGKEDQSLIEFIGQVMVGAATAFALNIPIWITSFTNAVGIFLNEMRPSISVLFSDFFGTILPTLLTLFARSAIAIGTALARLTLTSLDIFFTILVPGFAKAIPRMFGVLASGFKQSAGGLRDDLSSILIVAVGAITGFIAVKLGPDIASALTTAFKQGFGAASRQIIKDIGKLVRGFSTGFKQIGTVVLRILVALKRDVSGGLSTILGTIKNGFVTMATDVSKVLRRKVLSTLRRIVIILSRGLALSITAIGKLLQPIGFWATTVLPKVRKILGALSKIAKVFLGALSASVKAAKVAVNAYIRVLENLVPIFATVRGAIDSVLISLAKFGLRTGRIERKYLSPFIKTLARLSRKIRSISSGAIASFIEALRNLGLKTGEVGMNALTSLIKTFSRLGLKVGQIVRGAFGSFRDILVDLITKTGSLGKGSLTGLLDEMRAFGVKTGTFGNKGLDSFIKGLTEIGIKSGDAGNAIAKAFVGEKGPIAGIARIVKGSGGFGGEVFSGIVRGISSISKVSGTGLSKALPQIKSFGTEVISLAKSGPLRSIRSFGKIFVTQIDDIGASVVKLGRGGKVEKFIRGLAVSAKGNIGEFAGKGSRKTIGALGKLRGLNLTKAATSLKNLGTVFKGLKTIVAGFLTPFALITSAIDFFFFAWNTNIKGVENGAKGLIDNLRVFWADLISGKLFKSIVETAKQWFGTFMEVVSLISEFGFDSKEVQSRLQEISQSILGYIKNLGIKIWESIRTFWIPAFIGWIAETTTNLVESLGSILATVINWIGIAAAWLGNKIRDNWIPAFTEWWTEGGGNEKTSETLNNILSQIGSWITTAVEWIAGKLKVWVPGFIGWLVEVMPPLLIGLGKLLLRISKWIVETTPKITDKLLDWGIAFIGWIEPATKKGIEKLGGWLGKFAKWIITDGIPGIVKAAFGLVKALISWISGDKDSAEAKSESKLLIFLAAIAKFIALTLIPAVLRIGWDIAKGIWDGFKELWDEVMASEFGEKIKEAPARALETIDSWIQAGKDLIEGFIQGIKDWFSDGIKGILAIIAELLISLLGEENATKFISGGKELAEKLVKGIGDGIKDWFWYPISKIKEALSDLISKARGFLGKNSSSMSFADEVGTPIAEDIGKGIENSDISSSMKYMNEDIVGEMKKIAVGSASEAETMRSDLDKIFKGTRKDSSKTSKDTRDLLINNWEQVKTDTTESTLDLQGTLDGIFTDTKNKTTSTIGDLNVDVTEDFGSMRSKVEFDMIGMRSKVITEFATMKTDSLAEVDKMTVDITNALVSGPDSMINRINNAFIGTGDSEGAAQTLGLNFISGIAMGIISKDSYIVLYDAFVKIIDDTFDAIRELYGIDSPSEVAAKMIGEPIIEGIVVGMLRMMPAIQNAVDQITLKATGRTMAISDVYAPRSASFVPGAVTNTNSTRNYNLNVTSAVQSQGIVRDFATIQALG